jgi:hypothetical protein
MQTKLDPAGALVDAIAEFVTANIKRHLHDLPPNLRINHDQRTKEKLYEAITEYHNMEK